MKFTHVIYDANNDYNSNNRNIDNDMNSNDNRDIVKDMNIDNNAHSDQSGIYLFLAADDGDLTNACVAEAISCDIRGDYGFFLNRKRDNTDSYEWRGNMYNVKVDPLNNTVLIQNIVDDERPEYSIELAEWEEALTDWKYFYLGRMGFVIWGSEAMNHMFGVLLLAYDMWHHEIDQNLLFPEAIRRCAARFGVAESVINRDCRKSAGVFAIKDFYDWGISLFEHKTSTIEKLNDYIKFKINEKMGDIDWFFHELHEYSGLEIENRT